MEQSVTSPETSVQPPPSRSVSPRLIIWLILGLAFVVSANSIRNGFAYDDIGIIVTNPLFTDPGAPFVFFKQGYWGYLTSGNGSYRPVLMVSFWLNYRWTGMNPWSYHLVNVLLHTANVGLLILLLHRHRVTFRITAAAALVFAIHPVHTEAIANTVGRGELLAGFFFGLAWLCWDLYRPAIDTGEKHRPVWLIGCFPAYLLSILTKEHTLTLPALIFLTEVIRWSRSDRPSPFRPAALLPYLGFAAMFAICLLARMSVNRELTTTGAQGVAVLPFPHQLATMAAAAATWLRLLTVGFPLRPVYDQFNFGFRNTLTGWGAFGLAWMVAFAWLGWRVRRTAPLVAFAAGFWFVTASMMSNLFFSTGSIVAERLLYLPSISFALLLGWGFNWCREAERHDTIRLVAGGVLAALCTWYATVSLIRNSDWRNNETIFSAFLATDPGHPLAAVVLGMEMEQQGRTAEAVSLYLLALQRDPTNLQARNALGIYAFTIGNRAEFERIFTEILSEEPPNLQPVSSQWGNIHRNYGALLANAGEVDRARVQFERAYFLYPSSIEIQEELAKFYFRNDQPDRAVPLYKSLLQKFPDTVPFHNNLGVALLRLGRNDEAAAEFREILRLQPDHPQARANLDEIERKRSGK